MQNDEARVRLTLYISEAQPPDVVEAIQNITEVKYKKIKKSAFPITITSNSILMSTLRFIKYYHFSPLSHFVTL